MSNVVQEKSIKIKSVIGEPKGYIFRAAKDGKIKTDANGQPLDGEAVPLCFIIGRAREKGEHGRVKVNPTTGEASKDTWPVLLGDFECIPADTSRPTHRSPKAFLADHIIESVATVLADLRREGEIDPVVELAVRVDAVTDSASSAGFVYRWQSIREEAPRHDPLAEMRKLALAGVKEVPQLEAPKGEPDDGGEGGNKRVAKNKQHA